MVDSSTVQGSQKKSSSKITTMSRPLSLPRGLGKCFIHLCRQMLQMLQFLLGKSPRHPRVFLSQTKNGQLPPAHAPPPKVFKICFIEKGSQILKPGIFLGCPGNKMISDIQSSKPDQRTSHPVTPPQSWASGAAMTTVPKTSLVEASGGSWQIHTSFVMVKNSF